ncbi:MAG: hypothetical protein EAZ74_05240 [Alphaproteobacteria bacterium]|nr:MAG: hypothetical protein EAY76_04635 [Alphaproteobacteria bacterium]TAF13668.1 MAG: hypothetical protein EAZ74_05240 [Alphaproteobacteria bacterium]TAF39585.1 MAG: hypothetical protein EAZ66_04535 [Alphaproteobacteria bacterium]TAF75377.1 MAG: hypothetical protein EAZ52_06755 [Alphaproteobacteria bacterium]
MHLILDSTTHRLHAQDHSIRCAIGKGGVIDAHDKREGDGKTPLGTYPLRALYIRPDRIADVPACGLAVTTLRSDMGWCDDPRHGAYNQLVPLPFDASHELLWREDNRYDLIIPLGYNDAPIVPYRGSAIFFHVASETYSPTEGCVAIAAHDFLSLLPNISANSMMTIR